MGNKIGKEMMKFLFMFIFIASCGKSTEDQIHEKIQSMTNNQLHDCMREKSLSIDTQMKCSEIYLERITAEFK